MKQKEPLIRKSIAYSYEEEVIYVGDGAIKYADLINSSLTNKNKIASVEQQFICASAVGILAIEKYHRHDLLDLAGFVPVYLRSADAQMKKQTFP